jgi:3-oxoacyl-[acyl-carrier protein] reductase
MDLNLRGKRVFVIGASRGIGLATALEFAREGSLVAICARDPSDLAAARAQIVAAGDAEPFAEVADVTSPESFGNWAHLALEKLGGVDVMVWNVSAQSRSLETSLDVDLRAFHDGIERFGPSLTDGNEPALVVVCSRAALLAVPSYKAYSMVKAALLSYAGALAREWGPRGVRVNAVSPGEIEFPGGLWETMKSSRPVKYAEAVSKTAMGRLGRPEEVARVIVFLASPCASWVSGAHLLVDGMGREFVHF